MIVIDAEKLLNKIRLSAQVNPHDEDPIRRNHDLEHRHFANMVQSLPHVEGSGYVSVNDLWILLNQCHEDGTITDMLSLAEKIGNLKRLSEVV